MRPRLIFIGAIYGAVQFAHAQLSPEQSLEAFELASGLRAELAAAEPLVASPCAMAFDEHGRLFVAENRGYPRTTDPPQGRIALLEDADGDGRMDRRTTFAEGLTFPNGVMPWRGGLFVTCAPELLYFKDADGDGRAEERRVVLTGFDTKGSTQLRVNTPRLGPDGWIYLASGLSGGRITNPEHPDLPALDLKSDLRFDPRSGRFEAVDGRSQYGHDFDAFGRRFICMNRIQVQHVVLPSRYLRRNPHLAFSDTVQNCPELVPNPLMRSTAGAARLYPISANVTTADSHAGTFSAACAVTIWKGGALPAEYDGCALSCDPTANLVHVDRLVPRGATFAAEPLLEKRELLASRDDWFRPVFLANGPDGALYICDMYRKVVEHPDYLPEEVRKRTDFESGKELGRIWRVRTNDAPPRAESGWAAEMEFRLAVEAALSAGTDVDFKRGDAGGGVASANQSARAAAREVAQLWMLAIRGALEDADVEKSLRHEDAGVREVALQLAESRPAVLARLLEIREGRRPHASEREQFQLALTLGEIRSDEATRELAEIMISAGMHTDRWRDAAVLISAKGRALQLLEPLFFDMRDNSGGFDFFFGLGRTIAGGKECANLDALLAQPMWSEASSYALVAGFCDASGECLDPANERAAALLNAAISDLVGQRAQEAEKRRDALRGVGESPWMRDTARSAIALLAFAPWDRAREPLTQTALRRDAPEAAQAALRALAGFDRPEAAAPLLAKKRWAASPPAHREAVLGTLLTRGAFLPPILEAIERGNLPANALSAPRRAAFLRHKDTMLRTRAEKLFNAPPADRQKALDEAKAALALDGNGARGREVFRNLCAACHRLDREGHAVGPDLFDIRNQSKENILFHIVAPEAEVAPAFAAYVVETRDGRTLSGILASETPERITLRLPLAQEETIPRADVRSLAALPGSLMPPGLEAAVSRQDLADLLAYLKGEK